MPPGIYEASFEEGRRCVLYLAEIKANQGDYPQFYMNMDIALSKGISLDIRMKRFPEIYSRFKNDEKFLSILKRYNKDEEIELLKTL